MSCIISYKGQKYSEEQFKEYFINNKQEFATSIAKNKDVINSFKRKMEGIDYVFSQSPELASVGSKAQYLQYLSTIFPNSKVKDIVYHRTNADIDKFDRTKTRSNAFYFNLNSKKGEFKNLIKAVLYIKKYAALPTNYTSLLGNKNADITEEDLKNQDYDSAISFKSLNRFVIINEDTTVSLTKDISPETKILEDKLDKQDTDEFVVFEPEQIHILGSKADIQGFKEFVQEKQNVFNQISPQPNQTFDRELAQKIQDKLQKLYPEIKLNITNNPVWEYNDEVFNQLFSKKTKNIALATLISYSLWNANARLINSNLQYNDDTTTNQILKKIASDGFIYTDENGNIKNIEGNSINNNAYGYLNNLWKKAGYPKITINNKVGKSRYNPLTNTISINIKRKDFSDGYIEVEKAGNDDVITGYGITADLFLAEISHALQSSQGKLYVGKFILDFIKSKGIYNNSYDIEGTLEYEAHEEIEPLLVKEFENYLYQQTLNNKIIGQANIKAMTVLIDAVNQKQDTLPHEYAHHYIAWFRNTPIVQEAIKKWGSEEALVQSIGEQVVKQEGEAYNWWNNFVKWIMNQFNSLSKLQKEELTQILTDAFLTRQDLGSQADIQGFKEFVDKNNSISDISSLGKLQGDLMESEKGQIGVNKQQLLMLLGPTMYNKPLAQVAVKELLQNSFDAIKARMNITDNKETGNINITVNYDNRTISIKDDGIGMTPDIVKNAFLSIGGTNKEGLDVSERSGGFGLAKVQFLLGSEYVKVITVRDGIKTSLEATAVQLYNDDFTINKEQTNEPNGSYVEVKIPESYTTPEGTKREIEFPGKYKGDDVKYRAFDILDKPLIGNVNVSFTHVKNKQEYKRVVPIGENTTEETLPPLFSKIDFSWGSADLYMSTEKKENPNHRILSSGIYQFNHSFRFKDWGNIPYDIVVNIKPSVSSTSEQYPFNNQREGFKNTVTEDIRSLNNYLKKYASGEAEKDAKAVFSNITGLPKVDPNKVLTPEEREKLYADVEKTIAENKQRRIEQGLESAEEVKKIWKLVIDKEGVKDAETGKVEVSNEKNYSSSFKAEKEIEKVEAIETTNFNPALPQYHNNTNFDYLKIPGAAEFFSDFGSVVLEMVRFAGNELDYDYRKLKSEDEKFFAGVSIDKQYGGVHVRKIINAIFVNPLAFNVSSLEEAVGVALHVTIHEINHTTVSGEGASFTTALGILYGKIYATGKYGLYEGLFRSVYKKHFETFKQLKNEYDKSSTRNLSESFSGDQIKKSITGNVQRDVDDVSTGQSSTEGYTGNQENSTKDKTGDIILSKLLGSKQNILNQETSFSYFTKNNAFFIDHVTSEAMFDNIKSYLSFHYPGIKTYDDYRNYIFELNDKDTILNFINFVTKC